MENEIKPITDVNDIYNVEDSDRLDKVEIKPLTMDDVYDIYKKQ